MEVEDVESVDKVEVELVLVLVLVLALTEVVEVGELGLGVGLYAAELRITLDTSARSGTDSEPD